MLGKFKRGQIGETTTWLVATILIVIILLFFIFGSSLLAGTKDLKPFKEALFSESTFGQEDLILKKSIMTYYSINSESIRNKINYELVRMQANGEFNLDLNKTKIKIRGELGV
jgi:hypothetical protein